MRRPLAVVALLAAGLSLAGACQAPADDGASARATTTVQGPGFDADAAYALLERQVEFGPRVPGGAGHRQQLAWMESYLRERADTVALQSFTHVTEDGDTLPLTNVFARFRPEERDRLLLLAHWDTRPMADQDPDPERRDSPIAGANDGASGTAVLLQLADVLSRHSPPLGIDVLLVDGEDYGPGEMFIGSTYFAANLEPGYRPLYGVLLDMVGDRDPRYPIESNSMDYAPEVVRRVWNLAHDLGYGEYFPDRVGSTVDDDHIPLNRAGIRTIDIIDFEYGPANRYWHTTADAPDRTAADGLGVVGTVLTELIYRGG